jgi:hypothetical protein
MEAQQNNVSNPITDICSWTNRAQCIWFLCKITLQIPTQNGLQASPDYTNLRALFRNTKLQPNASSYCVDRTTSCMHTVQTMMNFYLQSFVASLDWKQPDHQQHSLWLYSEAQQQQNNNAQFAQNFTKTLFKVRLYNTIPWLLKPEDSSWQQSLPDSFIHWKWKSSRCLNTCLNKKYVNTKDEMSMVTRSMHKKN